MTSSLFILFIYVDHLYSALNHKNIGSERLTEHSEQLLKKRKYIPQVSHNYMAKMALSIKMRIKHIINKNKLDCKNKKIVDLKLKIIFIYIYVD